MRYKLTVIEQPPIKNSIYCEVALEMKSCTIGYSGQMWFVCDLQRNILQYFDWQKKYAPHLKRRGYTFTKKAATKNLSN